MCVKWNLFDAFRAALCLRANREAVRSVLDGTRIERNIDR
jgi:hypothetical protein